MRHFWRHIAFTLALVLSASQATAPAVGYVIENQAYADYVPSAGAPQRVQSNTVAVTVGQVSAFTLTAPQERFVAPGGNVSFFHTLTNTGNGADQFSLSLANDSVASSGGAFDFTQWQLFADANGDGIADNNIPLSSSPVLPAGGVFRFVAVAAVPASALTGQRDQLIVSAAGNAAYASSQGFVPAAAQTNIDGATTTLGAQITLRKSISQTQGGSPNLALGGAAQPITMTLQYSNTGFAAASNVLITDNLLAVGLGYNTQGFNYVAGSAKWNGIALTDAASSVAGGADLVGIDYTFSPTGYSNQVRATIANIPAGQDGAITFNVIIASGLAIGVGKTTNVATVTYTDGTVKTTDSNPATYTVIGRDNGTDFTLTKTAGNLVVPGQCSIFMLNVQNIGNVISSGLVTVTDTLPAGLVYQPSCVIQGVNHTSGAAGWTCPSVATSGAVTCTTLHNFPAAINGVPSAFSPIKIVVKADAAALVPPLPPVTAVPNTVVVLNTAVVSNANEPPTLRDNNTAQAPLTVGPAATIRGHVWLDVDHNRQLTTADTPMAGWRIELIDPVSGLVVATANTLANGAYELTGLLPGNYIARFRDPNNNVMNGRPVCNEAGLPSNVPANCQRTDLSNMPALQNPQGDGLLITVTPGDTIAQMSLPLDPSGVVYDSITRQPVAGAVVVLQYPAGFNPSIYLIGGLANISQTTSANGWYQYILTASGAAYCATLPNGCVFGLGITPPPAYRPLVSAFLPPSISIGGCAVANCIDPTGLGGGGGGGGAGTVFPVQSQNTAPAVGQTTPYYLAFQLSAGDPDVVNNHIPLDPITAFGQNLLIEKKASRATAEIGDFVDYTITVKNGAITPVNYVKLYDRLPAGFQYVLGTSRLVVNGVITTLPNPTVTSPASAGQVA